MMRTQCFRAATSVRFPDLMHLPMSTSTSRANSRTLPIIIQGGMGVAVSSWRLARAVSQTGQLGWSLNCIDTVIARRLQDGDVGGHIRRALEQFPVLPMAQRVLRRYFRPAGRAQVRPYILVPQLEFAPEHPSIELSIVANFAEVWLAKEGHDGLVGINYLKKFRWPPRVQPMERCSLTSTTC